MQNGDGKTAVNRRNGTFQKRPYYINIILFLNVSKTYIFCRRRRPMTHIDITVTRTFEGLRRRRLHIICVCRVKDVFPRAINLMVPYIVCDVMRSTVKLKCRPRVRMEMHI